MALVVALVLTKIPQTKKCCLKWWHFKKVFFTLKLIFSMTTLLKEKIIEVFEGFLDDKGLWGYFDAFIENQGYSREELGFSKE